MGLFDKVKSAARSAATNGVETARAAMSEVASLSPDLEAVGYRVTGIEVEIAVPPGVTVFLEKFGPSTDEAFDAVLANRRDSRVAPLLVSLLRQADKWSGGLAPAGRPCRQVAIDVGLRPAVRLLYGPPAAGVPLALAGAAENPPSEPEPAGP